MLTMTSPYSRASGAHHAARGIPEEVRLDRLDDPALIERCLDGEEPAWEALIRRYERLVYSIPMRYGMGEEVAADVFQSVCARLLEHLGTLKDRKKLASWLIMTTKRECWQVSHRLRREAPIGEGGDDDEERRDFDLLDDGPRADEELVRIERHEELRRAVSMLPDRSRELIELLFFAEDRPSYEEISRRLGMPVSSIGPTRGRCLEKLRELLP